MNRLFLKVFVSFLLFSNMPASAYAIVVCCRCTVDGHETRELETGKDCLENPSCEIEPLLAECFVDDTGYETYLRFLETILPDTDPNYDSYDSPESALLKRELEELELEIQKLELKLKLIPKQTK